jgi:hypothetical protein
LYIRARSLTRSQTSSGCSKNGRDEMTDQKRSGFDSIRGSEKPGR